MSKFSALCSHSSTSNAISYTFHLRGERVDVKAIIVCLGFGCSHVLYTRRYPAHCYGDYEELEMKLSEDDINSLH